MYHTVETVPAFNRKTVEMCIFDIPSTHINAHPWLSSCTSVKRDGVRLIYSIFFLRHFSYLIKTIESDNLTIFVRQPVNGRATVADKL